MLMRRMIRSINWSNAGSAVAISIRPALYANAAILRTEAGCGLFVERGRKTQYDPLIAQWGLK